MEQESFALSEVLIQTDAIIEELFQMEGSDFENVGAFAASLEEEYDQVNDKPVVESGISTPSEEFPAACA